MIDEALSIYVVYDQPKDFPTKVVVRRQRVGPGGLKIDPDPFIIADSVERARELLYLFVPGLACMQRHPQDEPAIVETWV